MASMSSKPCPHADFLGEKLRGLDRTLLQDLLAGTVHALQEEIPGLGEVVSFDVKHLYAQGARRIMSERMFPIATTKPNASKAIPTVNWASNAAPTRNSLMAPPKRKRNSSGAMALASLLLRHRITEM